MEKPLSHDYGGIMTDNRENILYPLIDPLPDSGIDGFIIEFNRYLIYGEKEFPMGPVRSFRDIVITNDIGSLLVDKGKGSYDDMGGGSGVEKRKYAGNDGIILLR